MYSRIIYVLSIALIFLANNSVAKADAGQLMPGVALSQSIEYFSWEEFSRSGDSIVRETGPRTALSLLIDNNDRRDSGLVYQLGFRLYFGQVDYDGQTQSGIPANSDTIYRGGRAEAGVGYRFAELLGPYGIDVLAAGGVDRWQRDIDDTRTSSGTFVSGAEEDYRIIYARAGLGLFHVHQAWAHYIQFGVRRPVETDEEARLPLMGVQDTVEVSPGKQESFYFSWQVDRLSGDHDRSFSLQFYYDSFRFERSTPGAGKITGAQAVQPESHHDVFGIRGGYYFD